MHLIIYLYVKCHHILTDILLLTVTVGLGLLLLHLFWKTNYSVSKNKQITSKL